ncbi:putative thioredoxin [Vibrio phage 424E50-1]|nr:putative thioredoxin [Vibrio phage 424E50-1]
MDREVKDILTQIDEMSDKQLIEALNSCDDYGLAPLLGEPDDWLLSTADRRDLLGKRMNEQKLTCPKCDRPQVQLIGYIDIVPAQWKCRLCKHKFEWEGVDES